MSQTAPKTFRELFDIADFRGVEIPIIQRDYAQGRVTATDIRNQFVDALYQALMLPADSDQLPLDLDFVYGSLDKSDLGTVFSPLDGQQRLTALFLLHWYLACHDGRLEDFQQFMCRGRQSRFSYKVRTSSDDFFDTLANAPFELPETVEGDNEPPCLLSRTIEDQPWFFLAWHQDPTVASALRVLDTIHERFRDTRGLYARLVDLQRPVITFQFLNLHDFGLSDELYIKMNARGKPLTEFEAFKARLGQKLDALLQGQTFTLQGRDMSPNEYFGHRVDSEWADVFWHYRSEDSRTFDRQFMNFVRGLATVAYPYAHREHDPKSVNTVMRKLIDHDEHYNYYRYDQDACLTPEFARLLISVLDQFSANGQALQAFLPNDDYYGEQAFFEQVLKRERRGVLQSQWIQFYGYCCYLEAHQPEPGDPRFADWMRVASNLALNTIINRADDFIRALVNVRVLVDEIGDGSILAYVADPAHAAGGLNKQQWREEQLKAQLILRHEEWSPLIMRAERHRYFRGQIEFLLDYSGVLGRWLESGSCDWTDEEDLAFRNAVETGFDRADAIFDEKGLRQFEDFAWERALLTVGDYLLPNGRNQSLLDNTDRDASWKRLLRGSDNPEDNVPQKRELVKTLLARVDPADTQLSLENVIADRSIDADIPGADWRALLVECPAAIAYCKKRFMRMTECDGILLLGGIRTSSQHAELRTFHLSQVTLPEMQQQGQLVGFDRIDYKAVSYESSLPRVQLHAGGAGISLSISFHRDRYQLVVDSTSDEPPAELLARMQSELHLYADAEHDARIGKCVPVGALKPAVMAVSGVLCGSAAGGDS